MKGTLALGVVLLVWCCVGADDKKEADDSTKLQGAWEMVEGHAPDGEKLPDDFVKAFRLKFEKDRYEVRLPEGRTEEGKVKLNEKENPRSITFTGNSGEERQGIYKWDGEKLKLCVNSKGGGRPKEFAAGDDNLLLVLKKGK